MEKHARARFVNGFVISRSICLSDSSEAVLVHCLLEKTITLTAASILSHQKGWLGIRIDATTHQSSMPRLSRIFMGQYGSDAEDDNLCPAARQVDRIRQFFKLEHAPSSDRKKEKRQSLPVIFFVRRPACQFQLLCQSRHTARQYAPAQSRD